jgi:hypothetical protein
MVPITTVCTQVSAFRAIFTPQLCQIYLEDSSDLWMVKFSGYFSELSISSVPFCLKPSFTSFCLKLYSHVSVWLTKAET